MATWAAKLACVKEHSQNKTFDESEKDCTIAVVDANVLISLGERARTLADILVTTDEVIAELRDAASRASIDNLLIVRRAPTDEAVRAVASFATKTGDLHQLSAEDVRLIALLYTYEVELYGDHHLRKFPVSVRAHTKRASAARMPGWGDTCDNEEWEAIDKIQDTDESASAPAPGTGTSKRDDRAVPAQMQVHDTSWEIAKRSKNAARRAKRKAEARARIAAAAGNHDQAVAVAPECRAGPDDASRKLDQSSVTGNHKASVSAEASVESDDEASSDSENESSGHSEHIAVANSLPQHDRSDESACLDSEMNSRTSRASLVTSDFPMQNVAIQMGLRLQSKGGLRITQIQRSVLRCDACSQVVKSQNKMFCPACGHATLSRVTVTIGPDGAEHYGVRKRHTLKGTRFSLPKPRGGKGSPAPILSEDVYNAKVRRPKARPAVDPLEELTLGEHKKFSGHSRGVSKGLSYLVTGPGKNPNERKNMPRSNRRR
eukprot:jgi/Ulvmu1/4906/UM020_0192.1